MSIKELRKSLDLTQKEVSKLVKILLNITILWRS